MAQGRVQIIGVVDLLHGRAVHARGGRREKYTPVASAAGWPIDSGDVRTLAETYIQLLGISEIYVADLDAIQERRPQDGLTRDLASLGAPLWLDAGIQSVREARQAMERGAARVVVGLETLPSFDVLASVCEAIGSDRVAFSLDLRDGQPLVMKHADISAGQNVETMTLNAVVAGASAVIVIDTARVGTGNGIDAAMLGRVRASAPDVTLIAGGGVRGWDDLVGLAKAGCNGALLATAVQNGSIGADEISAAREL
jgi:phosphoribosylformimino-5-aminoimidazole carboxamide ribotide isomerase